MLKNYSNSKKSYISKAWKMMIYDIFTIIATYTLVFGALVITKVGDFDIVEAFILLPFVVVIKIVIYMSFKVYRFITDNAGFDEVFRISIAVIISNFILIFITVIIPNFQFIPEVYIIFTTALEIFILVIPRIINRLIKYLSPRKTYMAGKRTLLVGAGAGGKLVLDEIRNNPLINNNPIGFVDDDETKIGNIMSGFPIFGPINEIPYLIDYYNIEEVFLCIANISNQRFQEIVNIIASKPVIIKRLPKFKEFQKDYPKKLLKVNVEDLLSRDIVKLDTERLIDFISGKKILVTGAGGSIGSELVRQIFKYKPKEMMLFDIYENGIYDLQTELNHALAKKEIDDIKFNIQIGSVYNSARVEEIFANFHPDLVFHAAAYKHVPLMEGSAKEAVRTNIIGTYNVCLAADKYEVDKVVLVSSDKAVRPTNVMGATKRFAEMILQYINAKSKTNYSAVRFGNVLGSNGSVIPLFRKQIEGGGPVTVTDKKIIRYFMTIPEAVGLILQSGTFAKGGEIFILDMGEPVNIYHLAEKMIMLSGMKPHKDIKIKITGLRPGEKLYEELLVNSEDENIKTDNKKIFIDKVEYVGDLEVEISKIQEYFESKTNYEIKEMIKKYVPSYTIKK